MSRFVFILGCVLASGVYWSHATKTLRNTLRYERSLPEITGNATHQGQAATYTPLASHLTGQIAYLEIQTSRETGYFDAYYEVREPEMITGFLKVIREDAAPSNYDLKSNPDPNGFHPAFNFTDACCPSFITLHYKPIKGVTPSPYRREHQWDLVMSYGLPMQEMLLKLGHYRAEGTRRLIAEHADEVTKIEWAIGRFSVKNQSGFSKPKSLYKGTTDKGEIRAILSQLKNVDARCFAYNDSVGVCPLKLTFQDGTTSLLKMELARDKTRKNVWAPDPACPKWLLDYRRRLEDKRKMSKPVPSPSRLPERLFSRR